VSILTHFFLKPYPHRPRRQGDDDAAPATPVSYPPRCPPVRSGILARPKRPICMANETYMYFFPLILLVVLAHVQRKMVQRKKNFRAAQFFFLLSSLLSSRTCSAKWRGCVNRVCVLMTMAAMRARSSQPTGMPKSQKRPVAWQKRPIIRQERPII